MRIRIVGVTKLIGILLVDFFLAYYILGVKVALLNTVGIMLYGWLGEYIGLLKDGAIRLDYLNDYERVKLLRVHNCLIDDVKRVSGSDISRLKLHIIPSDDINACAYGFNNVGITRATLNCCDETILCSVLGHEISHILNMDAVVNRLIFANVTLVIVGLIMASFITVSFMWIVFIILCAFGICGGLFSMFIFHGTKKLVKGTFTVLQHVVLFIYKVVIGIASRSCEFRADKYSCELGYGPQLSYFLNRFVGGQESTQRSLTEILYNSHPATYKRVFRIEQNCSPN